ncbi:aldo-keto reductase AKR2E4-like [Arctopsyche grandis]|uniref:aldo-keto reductase AKR2E4-like n=1 Tax=Arctopsyche grandis TaxID=121162 RepID=UPI00406D85A3
MVKSMTLKMNDGREIPVIGLGTYTSQGKTDECRLSVETAISCGYRHIDAAAIYKNEDEVGQGINNMIKKGVVTRGEIFLATKLWNDQHEEQKVVPALKASLKRLGLSYVDLYLVHFPLAINADGSHSDVDYLETWRGMEKCKELGLAKSIGVSNFNPQQLERLLNNCKVIPAVNQVEAHPNLTQKKIIEYCKSKNIVLTAWSPFGAMPEIRDRTRAPPAPKIDDPILTVMAKKYNKTTTQIVLRYLIDCGMAPLPKSITPTRIAQNIDVFDFALTPEEVKKIDEFNTGFRVHKEHEELWKDHKHYPF